MVSLIHWKDITLNNKYQYLIKHLIPAQDITVVWGKPKSGKTFIVLDMAIHVAAGIPYRGRPTVSGPVVYFTFEGAYMFPARIHAAMRGLGLDNMDMPFYYCKDARKFTKVGGADGVIESIRTLPTPPVLVVLDTVNRSLDGSENSDEDMTHYTRCAEDIGREFNCAVIVIHHARKSGDVPRGHTSLTGTCAAQLHVNRASKGRIPEGQPMMVSITVEFMKDGPEGGQEFCWLTPLSMTDEHGQDVVSCYCTEAPKPAGDDTSSLTGISKKALSILQKLIMASETGAVTYTEWRHQFEALHGGKRDTSRKAFNRAYDMLVEKGMVKISGVNVSLAEMS